MVIVPESSFKRMPMSPERVRAFFNQQLADMEAQIVRRARENGGEDPSVRTWKGSATPSGHGCRRCLMRPEKDPGPYFDQELGIDNLMVDEAQDFKNLAFQTENDQYPRHQ